MNLHLYKTGIKCDGYSIVVSAVGMFHFISIIYTHYCKINCI